MRRNAVVWGILSCFMVVLGICGGAWADTLLFPVIAINPPNVTTIISVMTWPFPTSTSLHYIYRYKDSLTGDPAVPNLSGECNAVQFTMPTSSGDVVSFDASGIFDNGNALFGDTNSGIGNYSLGLPGPKRAYLLVRNTDGAGAPDDTGTLAGEAIVMDIAAGAAWGYRAVNDSARNDYGFPAGDGGVPSGDGAIYEFNFFPPGPPESWTTRFFVTPTGLNMNTANISSVVGLFTTGGPSGFFDRNGVQFTFPLIEKTVTCTAAVDLVDLIDATSWAAVQSKGGWSWFWVKLAGEPAIVYKLEFVINNPKYGGTNNNGVLMWNP